MKLTELHPKLEGTLDRGVLIFDCPIGHAHKMRVRVHRAPYAETGEGKIWQAVGEFPGTLTLVPSINANPSCWHGNITNGVLT